MNRRMAQGTVANNVQVIPATKRRVSAGGQLKKAKDIRVAAYGRVSTDELSQQTSYEGQKSYYTKLINDTIKITDVNSVKIKISFTDNRKDYFSM